MVKEVKMDNELVPIKVRKPTRRKFNIAASKHEKTHDEMLDYLVEFEYKYKDKV